ncbi:hypothetical protein AAW14_20995 [Streptomyces hygroscopicus]|uniref:DoxX family protein n=1 Tax=Streptomyces hygroscopicus TaxID=1912 RepID=UPI00223F6B53|nr:DoxX family protein [Streptomyces hygroscopicus]MCW7944428.1 hypothetical protein [Streptomyces hygroscopicus]
MSTVRTILNLILGTLFVCTGGVKVVGLSRSLKYRDHFGMAPSRWKAIGVLEASGGLGVLVGQAIRPLEMASLAGLCALMSGAVLTHVRARDPIPAVTLASGVLALTAVSLVISIVARR